MFDEDKNKNKPRGMFDEAPKEEKKTYHHMFEEDRASHHMTKKKERTIAVVVVIVAVIITLVWMMLSHKWVRERWRHITGISAPKSSYSVCVPDRPAPELLL